MARRKQPPPPPEGEAPSTEDFDLMTDPQFIAFIEASGGLDLDPLSDEGVRLQAQYIKQVGDHPLDVLKVLSKNPFVKPSDRIAAAKALLEYGARKVPAEFKMDGSTLGVALPPQFLKKLSSKELDTLEKLLLKAQGT
jgi:hypothetical protein